MQGVVGDEVLCLFDDVATALSSTFAMQEATDQFSARRGTPMSLRIGLHHGPTIVEQGRVFGDTVNTAARMAAIAQGGQIIASEDVVKRLTDPFKDMARRFDRVRVKGKQEPIVVYDLLWQPALVTEILPSVRHADAPVVALSLCYEGQRRQLNPGRGAFSIGRAPDNDLVVMSGSVSRKHATIDFGRDRFVLLDTSTNGTYVETQNGEMVFLRREAFPLWGQGRIALGASVTEGLAHIIEFRC